MAADERRGEEELLLVQALWRHGDRTPVKTWKTDPYQVATWPKVLIFLYFEAKMVGYFID
jgi:hypothetical protein